MIVRYKDKKTKKILESKEKVNKKYGEYIFESLTKKIKQLTSVSDLQMAINLFKGMRIEKLKKSKSVIKDHYFIWSFRLNIKYRCNFWTEKEKNIVKIRSIEIEKIHPHKYEK